RGAGELDQPVGGGGGGGQPARTEAGVIAHMCEHNHVGRVDPGSCRYYYRRFPTLSVCGDRYQVNGLLHCTIPPGRLVFVAAVTKAVSSQAYGGRAAEI